MYLYLCKSTIWPCMEYCCHVWAGTPNCYLDMLDRLQKQVCRTVCPSLAASLELLTQRQNVTSFSVFFGYYLVDVHLNLLNWFCFLFLVEGQWLLHDFAVTIRWCYKNVYIYSFFQHTARLWNSLFADCFRFLFS